MTGEQFRARTLDVLRAKWPQVEIGSFAELNGGASSLTFVAGLSGGPADRVVVKVAPPGLEPIRNRDVLRQADLLEQLVGHEDVHVPAVFGRSTGTSLDEPPLFVMSFDPGDSEEPLHIHSELATSDVHSRAVHAVRMLVALQNVTIFGQEGSGVSPLQELDRWAKALTTVTPEHSEGTSTLLTRLRDSLPTAGPAVLLHGDWRLGNMLCVGPTIESVIDWEIWSIGDGRFDLAWFLMMCDTRHPAAIAGPETGMPPIAELVSHFEECSGRPVSDLGWFRALVVYKQVAATALIAKHSAKRGIAMEPVSERINRNLPEMVSWANELLTAG
jgi:aminoglycoside phosphotransferase (APT) family kinase protein